MSASSYTIKFVIDGEIRRVSFPRAQSLTLQALEQLVREIAEELRTSKLRISWRDEDGDEVRVGSDYELREALQVQTSGGASTLRFHVAAEKLFAVTPHSAASQGLAVHAHVQCDECGVCPIVGVRYKCAVRENFDLCAQCEARRPQPHAMLKIALPAQTPAALLVALRESEEDREGDRESAQPVPSSAAETSQPAHTALPPQAPQTLPAHTTQRETVPPFMRHGHGGRGAGGLCGGVRTRQPQRERGGPHLHRERGTATSGVRVATWKEKDATSAFVRAVDTFLFGAPAEKERENEAMEKEIVEAMMRSSLSLDDEVSVLPSLRFVRSVTFPDNSRVRPQRRFTKTWRVRNDGAQAWPQGCILRPAGGALLADRNLAVALPSLAPNEEADVSISLGAPLKHGPVKALFSAETSDGRQFGQSLWAAVVVGPEPAAPSERAREPQREMPSKCESESVLPQRVSDEEREVEIVSRPSANEELPSEPEREGEKEAASEPESQDAQSESLNEDWDVVAQSVVEEEQERLPLPVTVSVSASASLVSVSDVESDDDEPVRTQSVPTVVLGSASAFTLPVSPTVSVSTSTSASSSVSSPAPAPAPVAPASSDRVQQQQQSSFSLLWRKELQVLAEMGFGDVELAVIAPLLQQYLVTPAVLRGGREVDPEGMQRVITALLGN